MCPCANTNVCPVVNDLRNPLYYEVEADSDITNTREAGKRHPFLGQV